MMAMMNQSNQPKGNQEEKVLMGKLGAPHGVRGAIKVHSFSNPATSIFSHKIWHILTGNQWQAIKAHQIHKGHKHLIAKLDDIDDRDIAKAMTHAEIFVEKSQLPELPEGQYHWEELLGMEVMTVDGQILGTVTNVMNTGANDILEVSGERSHLLPFIENTIVNVNKANNTIVVDWDPNF